MPTWEPVLKEEERWNVINFLHATFAPKTDGRLSNAPPAAAPTATKGGSGTKGPEVVQRPPAVPDLPRGPRDAPGLAATSAPAGASESEFVRRAEYDRLAREHAALRDEFEQFKKERAAGLAAVPVTKPASQEDVDDLQKAADALTKEMISIHPGTEKFFVAGDAFIGFTAQHHNNSTFSAGLAPLLLWKPTSNLLFESSFDLGLNTNPDASSSTSIDLTIADAIFFINDWLSIGGGVFVTPFGVYHTHFDPPWINKFADDPLPFGDRAIAPGSSLGLFVRGAKLVANSKIVYDVYVSNGPNVITTDRAAAGSLSFDNWNDINNNKAVGARIGFIPVPNLETGYSIFYGTASPSGFPSRVHATLQAVDINYRPDVPALAGTFDFRAEWIWSDVSKATYDPTGANGFGPLSFSNYRDGGYVQLCYRPTHVHNEIIRNFEIVSRWDLLRVPDRAPGGGREQRYTIGLDYWINPQAVLKLDYEFDRRAASLGPAQDALLLQLGLGL